MKLRLLSAAAAVAVAAASAPATAATYIVDAFANSSNTNNPVLTGQTFAAGQAFYVRSSVNDLWSSGSLPRWSNGNGLIADRFATGTDESGEAAGTKIGQNFGLFEQDGYSAPYGSLVGRIGSQYQLLGANGNFIAWQAGELELFYWDTPNSDNSQSIAFNIAGGVPEPTTWAMMILGFGVIGGAVRARRRQSVKVSLA